jgi:hypothetical protein
MGFNSGLKGLTTTVKKMVDFSSGNIRGKEAIF